MNSRLILIVCSIFSVCCLSSSVFADPPGTGWKIKLEDTFDDSLMNRDIWDIVNGSARKEVNSHLYRQQNLILRSGLLQIKNKALSKGRFIGGSISSKQRFKYGYFEIKCSVTERTDNLMANFWLGNRNTPNIMVMGWDHIQFKQNLSPLLAHFISEKDQSLFFKKALDPTIEHVYGFLWAPGELSFYLDDKLIGTSRRSDLAADIKPLRLYLSSNHDWTNPFSEKVDSLPLFSINHIKVWQKKLDNSRPKKAITASSKNPHAVRVNTSLKEYKYDFGTVYSPTERGHSKISSYTTGDIYWRQKPRGVDRGAKFTNRWLRDHVSLEKPCTLRHRLTNGTWHVTLAMGDALYAHDLMSVTVEGAQKYKAKSVRIGDYATISFTTTVTDGWLDLTMADEGGDDPNWVLSKMTITRK